MKLRPVPPEIDPKSIDKLAIEHLNDAIKRTDHRPEVQAMVRAALDKLTAEPS